MTIDTIKELIILWAPTIAAVFSYIGLIFGVIRRFNNIREDLAKKDKVEALEDKLERLTQQNEELQKLLYKEIETNTKIKEKVI